MIEERKKFYARAHIIEKGSGRRITDFGRGDIYNSVTGEKISGPYIWSDAVEKAEQLNRFDRAIMPRDDKRLENSSEEDESVDGHI